MIGDKPNNICVDCTQLFELFKTVAVRPILDVDLYVESVVIYF